MNPAVNFFDLNSPPANHSVDLTLKREETAGERCVRLFKDITLFALAVAFVVTITVICYQTATTGTASPDDKKWAMSFLSGSAAGLIGYLIRK